MQAALGELSHLDDAEKGGRTVPEKTNPLVSLYHYRSQRKDLSEIQKKAQFRPEALPIPGFHECLLHVSCWWRGEKSSYFSWRIKQCRCCSDNLDVLVKKWINKPVITANCPLFFGLGDRQISLHVKSRRLHISFQ